MGTLLAAACVPFPYVLCPAWEVTVVDGRHRALAGMDVQRHCRHYALVNVIGGAAQCHEERRTDGSGRTAFAEVRRSASLMARVLGILNMLRTGAYTGLGRHGYVWASGNGREGSAIKDDRVIDWRGGAARMRTTVVARRTESSAGEELLFRVEFSNPARVDVEVELRLGEPSCDECLMLSRKSLNGEAGWIFSARARTGDSLCYRLHYAGAEATGWQRLDARTSSRNLSVPIPAKVGPIG
ncbi:MAG: hypothetical protein HY820_19835 [Acidobacteria bacterium]|nr:hypothetical protein [Acidobacteriota bacterium]